MTISITRNSPSKPKMMRFLGLFLVLSVVVGLLSFISPFNGTTEAKAAANINCYSIGCSLSGGAAWSGGITYQMVSVGGVGGGGGVSVGSCDIDTQDGCTTTSSDFYACTYWSYGGGAGTVNNYPADAPRGCGYGFVVGGATGCPVVGGKAPVGVNVVEVRQNVGGVGGTITTIDTYNVCVYPANPVYPTSTYLLNGTGRCYIDATIWWSFAGKSTGAAWGGYNGAEVRDSRYTSRAFDPANPTAGCGGLTLDYNFATVSPLPDGYGYYKRHAQARYYQCSGTRWPAWTGLPDQFSCSGPFTEAMQTWRYTYSCNANPPLRAGVDAGAIWDPSTCTQANWQCVYDRSNVEISGTTSNVSVMRSGEDVRAIFPRMTPVGSAINSVESTESKTELVSGSTPYNGAVGPNDGRQYFDYMTSTGADANIASWEANDPNRIFHYYWATDSGGFWQAYRNYRFIGYFAVRQQTGVYNGTSTAIVRDAADCPQTYYTPRVTVLRSAVSP